MTQSAPILTVEGVSLSFGGTHALTDVSFTVDAGEILGIIGPNGSGKTSILNCVSGVVRPQLGHIRFADRDLTRTPVHHITTLGVARTFQAPSLEPTATVLDNVLLGSDFTMRYGLWAAIVRIGRARRQENAHRQAAREILGFLGLAELSDSPAGDLPWGLQKVVEIGRALASEPSLILLDEPTSGMTQEEKESIGHCLLRVTAELGITIVLIEHDAPFVGRLCSRLVALDFGRVVTTGTTDEVLTDPRVIAAYLGAVVPE